MAERTGLFNPRLSHGFHPTGCARPSQEEDRARSLRSLWVAAGRTAEPNQVQPNPTASR